MRAGVLKKYLFIYLFISVPQCFTPNLAEQKNGKVHNRWASLFLSLCRFHEFWNDCTHQLADFDTTSVSMRLIVLGEKGAG